MLLQQIFTASESILEEALTLSQAGDALLLAADGCYLTQSRTLDTAFSEIAVFALEEDMVSRGLSATSPVTYKTLTDTEWVELTARAQQIKSWP